MIRVTPTTIATMVVMNDGDNDSLIVRMMVTNIITIMIMMVMLMIMIMAIMIRWTTVMIWIMTTRMTPMAMLIATVIKFSQV